MTPAILTMLWAYLRRILASKRPKKVRVIDGAGRPLDIDEDLVPALIRAEVDEVTGKEHEGSPFVWYMSISGMRAVIEMARAADSADDALLTIFANTSMGDDCGHDHSSDSPGP